MKKLTLNLFTAIFMLTVIIGFAPDTRIQAATEYHAYMGIQTEPHYLFRNAWDDPNYGLGSEEFKGITADGILNEGTFTDVTFTKDGTYTVVLDKPDFAGDTGMTQLFVSTDIPMSSKIKVTNVILKIDGSIIHTFDKGVIDMESKNYINIMCINKWRKELNGLFTAKLPFTKCEITFTVKGIKEAEAEKRALKDFIFDPKVSYVNIAGYTGSNTSITLPTNALRKDVTGINANAFEKSAVKKVSIPNTVTTIGKYAFYKSKLTSMSIPKSVTTIQDGAFASCSGIQKFIIDKGNVNYVVKDGILFTKDMKTLVQYPAGKTSASYTIPSSVTKIQGGAFDGCTKLTKLTISANVKTLGNDVFKGCKNLTIYAPTKSEAYKYAEKQGVKVKNN